MPIARSSAAAAVDDQYFSETSREGDEDNVDWVARTLRELRHRGRPETFVLLVGGTGIYDFRLRVAQSHLRHDMTPSHWSHAAVIAKPDFRSVGRSLLLECSLEPVEGFGLPSQHNGIQGALLSRYADPVTYPNIALLRVPVSPDRWSGTDGDVGPILEQLALQRSTVDVPTLIVRWLAFVWGAEPEGNPLLRGQGIPAAVVIDSLLGAAGFDLCPGIDSAASCPESFWQTAKWWTRYLDGLNLQPVATRYRIGTTAREGSRAAFLTVEPSAAPAEGPRVQVNHLTERLFDEAGS